MDDAHPLSRQMRLFEIGPSGQARLDAARLVIGTGPGSPVELSYLCRAGVGNITLTSHDPCPSFPHAPSFRHTAARDFAAGSWRALTQIKKMVLPESP
ncbi:MAG TPA: hypothetical protein VGI10_25275 [Polyangiaceae bacterium]|jgi:hypothetical protein